MSDKVEWIDTVVIRLIRESDLPEIEWNGEYARYRKIYREMYRNFFLLGISTPWVAEAPGIGLVGQVFLTKKKPNHYYDPDNNYMFLSSLRVRDGYRNMGLGTRLLEKSVQTTRQRNLKWIFLNCAQRNLRGREFYERNGFEVVRDDPSHWTYVDENGTTRTENEPSWVMKRGI